MLAPPRLSRNVWGEDASDVLSSQSLEQLQQPQTAQASDRSLNRPLWCIHPIGGHGLAFAPLARLLDSTLLEPRLIELPSPLPHVETLSALAELYTAQILTEQQQGAFALIGYSFGGVVAEYIAAELQRRGQKVNFLGILEPIPLEAGLAPGNTPCHTRHLKTGDSPATTTCRRSHAPMGHFMN